MNDEDPKLAVVSTTNRQQNVVKGPEISKFT